jgi:CMP-N-acetylneuraminic acid synthetase
MVNFPRNVFQVCPEYEQRVAPSDEYKIIKRATGEVLRICKGQVSLDDLKRAGRCARFETFRAYKNQGASVMLTDASFPMRSNIYIVKAYKSRVKSNKTKVFSVCETTTVAPTRSSPAIKVNKNAGKKKILNTAITALKTAINALEELSRTL